MSLTRNTLPIYIPEDTLPDSRNKRFGYVQDNRLEWRALLGYEISNQTLVKAGVLWANQRYEVDVSRSIFLPDGSELTLPDARFRYSALRLQWVTDSLDSVSFPTDGLYFNASTEEGLSGGRYSRLRLNAQWARSWGAHIVNAGFNLGADRVPDTCVGRCEAPTGLFMGGFQQMGAYRMGQLGGDRLAHAQVTYMHRVSDGGLLRQRMYLGLVAERGDAWLNGDSPRWKNSLTVFGAIDSRIGDIYAGAAWGSNGIYNVFLQLGRRFSF